MPHKVLFDIGMDGIIQQYPTLSIDILEWFKKRYILPTSFGIGYAMAIDRFDIVQWLQKNNRSPTQLSLYAYISSNTSNNIIDKLNWFAQYNILPETEDINQFIINNSSSQSSIITILQWLESKDIPIQQHWIVLALLHHSSDILQWMEQRHHLPTTHTLDQIETYDPFILLWSAQRGIYPTSKLIIPN